MSSTDEWPSDHTLLARAFTRRIARWEPFSTNNGESGESGELCFLGLRWASVLDDHGVPELSDHTRAKLREALT